jgi:hypothetical protein
MDEKAAGVWATLLAAFCIAAASWIGYELAEQTATNHCERFGAFYVRDVRYECKAAPDAGEGQS